MLCIILDWENKILEMKLVTENKRERGDQSTKPFDASKQQPLYLRMRAKKTTCYLCLQDGERAKSPVNFCGLIGNS